MCGVSLLYKALFSLVARPLALADGNWSNAAVVCIDTDEGEAVCVFFTKLYHGNRGFRQNTAVLVSLSQFY